MLAIHSLEWLRFTFEHLKQNVSLTFRSVVITAIIWSSDVADSHLENLEKYQQRNSKKAS